MYENEVIGFFAFKSMIDILCIGEACIIAGSRNKIRKHVKEMGHNIDAGNMSIKSTTYGEIKKGMSWGAVYAFDQESFQRFKPFAGKEGLNLSVAEDKGLFLAAMINKKKGDWKQKITGLFGKISSLFFRPKAPWLDKKGLHMMIPKTDTPDLDLQLLTENFQKEIQNSEIFTEMVKQFGREEAERMLKEFKVKSER